MNIPWKEYKEILVTRDFGYNHAYAFKVLTINHRWFLAMQKIDKKVC